MTTVADLVPAHTEKRYDLGVEPWLPVQRHDGTVEHIGLQEALRNGHLYAAIALSCPLERSSALRYLTAMTYLVHAYADEHIPQWDPADSVRNGEPLPSEAVDAVCTRMSDHWWLVHPVSPFLQNPAQRLLAGNKVTARMNMAEVADPWQTLSPSLPSKNNEAWWGKPYEIPTTIDPARAACLLLVRHYCALPGNEAAIHYSGRVIPRCEGSLAVSVGAPTAFYQHAGSLAATLLANLTADMVGRISWNSRCFWEELNSSVPLLNDALYLYTFSTAGSFLVDDQADGEFAYVLRGSQPFTPSVAKTAIFAARLADPHMLRTPKKPGVPLAAVTDTYNVVLDADASQFSDAYTFFAKAINVNRLRDNVLDKRRLAYPPRLSSVDVVPITLTGATMNQRFNTVAGRRIDPRLLEADIGHAAALTTLLDRLAGPTGSVRTLLAHWSRDALAETGLNANGSLGKAVGARVTTQLWDRFDGMLRDQTDAILALTDDDITTSSDAYLAAVSLSDSQKTAWVTAALAIYDEVTRPFETSGHGRKRIVKNRTMLGRKLWNALSAK